MIRALGQSFPTWDYYFDETRIIRVRISRHEWVLWVILAYEFASLVAILSGFTFFLGSNGSFVYVLALLMISKAPFVVFLIVNVAFMERVRRNLASMNSSLIEESVKQTEIIPYAEVKSVRFHDRTKLDIQTSRKTYSSSISKDDAEKLKHFLTGKVAGVSIT